ncbi:nucleoside deaminase [Azovibrio restrictus]|uniref:nucleoside deaminase n=1 Tax=Azovibrio restrictus TaxID=146938 RepID=UPI0026F28759|nr:nucleoside deaminase [Azovibrio restrictus]
MADLPPTQQEQDERFLRRTLELALLNVERGEGGPFGALITRDGEIIAEAWNRVVADKDPTAHAEILAIRAACRKLGHFHLSGCTLYASSEPCPMCLAAAYWARVDRIVYANDREAAAAIGFSDAALYDELQCPPGRRQVPTLHLPLPEARVPLETWLARQDRTRY